MSETELAALLETLLPQALADADDAGADADDWIGSEYVMRMAASLAPRLRAELDVSPCWFCHREVPIDTLIAGYDTFEESRLACNTCNDAIQWLNDHGLVVSRTPAR